LLAVYDVNPSIACVVVRVDDPVLLAVQADRCKWTDNVDVNTVQEAGRPIRRPPRDLLLRVAKKANFARKVFVVSKA
jgi:hypothetical protein